MIPGHIELERRLGAPYRLDGSFAALWAIERILETVRRMPRWAQHVGWLKDYMANFFAAAFSAMEIRFTRSGNSFECKNIRYSFDVGADIDKIIHAAGKQPMFYGLYTLGWPVMNLAALPYYAFATLAQNQEWAEADHDMIGRRRDHLDRVTRWLVEDTLRGIELPPGISPKDAGSVAFALVWPPLGFQMNEKAEFNLENLGNRAPLIADQYALPPLLRSFARSQNYFVRLIAAEYCKMRQIEPQNQDEALAYREACAYFATPMPASVANAVTRFLPDDEADLPGRDEAEYLAYSEAVRRGDYSSALASLDTLLAVFPANAMFLCSRGDTLAHLGRQEEALVDFHESIRLNPRYWQARINRGVLYSRAGHYDRADADLFEAAKIRFGDPNAANNLLCSYFFRKDAGL